MHSSQHAHAVVLAAVLLAVPSVAGAAEGLTAQQTQALRLVARKGRPAWPALSSGQVRSLYDKAEAYLHNFKQYHLPHGMEADIYWTDTSRTRVRQYDGLGDSACWLGHYLAALALRYHVTNDPQTLKDILAVFDSFDLLTRVSGRVGYVARCAMPADDPAYIEYYKQYGHGPDSSRPGFGKAAYPGALGYQNYVWLGSSSRDTYDGVAVGLAAVLRYVDDSDAQARARQLARRIGERLIADKWRIVDGQGHTTRATANWKLEWLRLLLSADPAEFASLHWDYERSFRRLVGRQAPPWLRGKHSAKYYPNNLDFARLFVLSCLENESDRHEAVRARIRMAYREIRDHLNAYFAAIYLLATGDPNRNARATLEGMLLDFPLPPRWLRAVDSRQDPGVEMANKNYAQDALLAHERPVRDFMWQRSPCLAHGGKDAPLEYPGIDMFLPYWMGRVAGVIPAP